MLLETFWYRGRFGYNTKEKNKRTKATLNLRILFLVIHNSNNSAPCIRYRYSTKRNITTGLFELRDT